MWSKKQRMQTPEKEELEDMELAPPECKITRTISGPLARSTSTPPAHRESTPTTTSTSGATEEEEGKTPLSLPSTDRKRKTATIENPKIADVMKRLEKENGVMFIPLSTGRYLSDVWWTPMLCEIDSSKKQPFILLHVCMYYNFGGRTLDFFKSEDITKVFRISNQDALMIAFLLDRMLRDIHSELKNLTYNLWFNLMCEELDKENCENETVFAAKVLSEALKGELVRLPCNFRLFFQKKPHVYFSDIDKYPTVLNRNSVLCKAENADFEYEIRINLFEVDHEVVCRKKKEQDD